jgi:hypothetical protein
MNDAIDISNFLAKYLVRRPCRNVYHSNTKHYCSPKHQPYSCKVCAIYSTHLSFSYICKKCKHQYCCFHYIEHILVFSLLATLHEPIKCSSSQIPLNANYIQRISYQNSKALGRHIHGMDKPIRFSSNIHIDSNKMQYCAVAIAIISTALIKSICIQITCLRI